MKPACFRGAFISLLQELTWINGGEDDDDDFLYSVEYLSRGPQWFHFQGCRRSGATVCNGRSFDARTGAVSAADPNMLTFALLDFLDNRDIAAYMGPIRVSTRIAQRMIDARLPAPEVVRISLERQQSCECGTRTHAATEFAFVGLLNAVNVDDIGSGLGLAAMTDEASAYWYRARTRIDPQEDTRFLQWCTA